MPKLILFTACQKVIVDQYDNSLSLVSVLEALRNAVPTEEQAKIPEDAAAPLTWYVLALWRSNKDDEGVNFEAKFAIEFAPDHEEEISTMPFQFEKGKPNFRNTLRVEGLKLKPLIGVDAVYVKAYLRKQNAEQWKHQGTFPVIVLHPEKKDEAPNA